MGKKEKEMRLFASRLTWRIVLMMLIIMGLVAWLIYGATSEFVLGADGMRQEVFRDGYVSEMRRNISDIYTSTYNHVPEIEENLANPDRLSALVERVVRLNPQVRSCGISFIADYYPKKGHWYCPYAVRTDSSHVETKIIGGPSHDYLSAGWFKEGMEAAKTLWSKPFFDGTDSVAPLVSCLFPIHDRTGRTVAVLGSDMSLEWLAKKMRWTDWETFSQEWVSPSREVVEKYQNNDLDFDGMQQSLTKYVEELKHTTASKAAIENELQVAHDIQMGMLPKIFPPYPERSDIEVFGSLNPAKEVGGDLFDFYIRDNQLFFCIGDVSGKGVPASLVMAVTRSLFRNISAHTAKPDHIAAALNEALAEGNETNMFVTSFIGVLNLSTGMLRYCNAGHDAPILIGRGVGLLPCDSNLPLGVMPGWEFTVQEADIDPQTTIFLFTDGLTEAEDANHAQFGIGRVTAIAEKMLAEGKNTPVDIITQITKEVHAFVSDAEQSDDLTMLAVKYKG